MSYAKKNFYKDENGDLQFKLKISSDCLKNSIFSEDVLSQNPNIVNCDALLYSYIGSPVSLLRGYLFADKLSPFKRKGAFTIIDAEQTSKNVTNIETFSRSGVKNTDTDNEKSDNSFYLKETVGDIEYSTIGNIDLMQLQFISCDQMFDRYAFNPDKFDLFKMFLTRQLNNFNSELAYYKQNTSVVELGEYGILLSNDNVVDLVNILLLKLNNINISRKNAFAKTSILEYKLVYNPIEDKFADEDGWIKYDGTPIEFDAHTFYTEMDRVEADRINKEIKDTYDAKKKADKAEKSEKDLKKQKSKKQVIESTEEV